MIQDSNSGDVDPTSMPVSSQEEKELRRVFEMISGIKKKNNIKQTINRIREQVAEARARESELIDARVTVNKKKVEEEDAAVQRRIDTLLQELHEAETDPERKISVGDIMEITKCLHQPMCKKEAQELVWEVDDDLDMCIDWPELRLMYTRNISDRTGLEPSKLFFLVQFLIYDRNENGRVSVDETMNMLYARYGRVKMETKLRELFGANMHETGLEGGEIGYPEFLRAVERIQQQTFWGTTQGKIVASRGGKPTIPLTSSS